MGEHRNNPRAGMKNVPASDNHKDCRLAVLGAMKPFTDAGMAPADMLAVLAYTVGQCLAMQDQRAMTAEQGIDLIRLNIEQGNADAIAFTLGSTKGSA